MRQARVNVLQEHLDRNACTAIKQSPAHTNRSPAIHFQAPFLQHHIGLACTIKAAFSPEPRPLGLSIARSLQMQTWRFTLHTPLFEQRCHNAVQPRGGSTQLRRSVPCFVRAKMSNHPDPVDRPKIAISVPMYGTERNGTPQHTLAQSRKGSLFPMLFAKPSWISLHATTVTAATATTRTALTATVVDTAIACVTLLKYLLMHP